MGKTGVLAAMLTMVSAAVAAGGDEVILKSRQFVPAAGVSAGLRGRLVAAAPDRMHVLIQLDGIPTVERRAAFVEEGVKLLSYIPNRAWLASIPADRAAEVAQLAGVRAVCEILPQDKLAPSIRETGINACSTAADGRAWLTALFFQDVTLEAGAAVIAALGGTILDRDPVENNLVFHLPASAIYTLAAYDGVKWIDQHYPSTDLNDGVRLALDIDPVQVAPYNLTGSGVVIGQWESKHPDDTHVDLAGRVTNVDDQWPVGDHATQVAGTMIGDGRLLPDRRYRGMAPAATLVSYHSWDNVSDLRRQYQEAIRDYQIDIANNSWAKVEWHAYKDYTAAMDGIVRGSLGKPISIVWAVGNEGGWATVLCTAVGKNVVTVGATNSDDNSLWSWSNKGPTADGRLKPDVVSPGCEVRSGGSIWSTLPGNRYGGSCGTSLAAPSVSGAMALILEDWRATHDGDPLPSTVKGLLIHTATDLGNPGPDHRFGYGLISAKKAIDLVRADTLDDAIVEGVIGWQGERDLYTLRIGSGEEELKISLVWDDYPADPLTAHALVNDLDLVVIGPDGKRRYPWLLDPYEPNKPAERTQADHTNNVEQVCVENPQKGTWQVAVWGVTVPQGHQTYSLLMTRGGLVPVSTGTSVLSVTDHLGNAVAEFDDSGNLFLQGALVAHAEPTPPPGAFVFRGPDESVAGYIDLIGNMSIRGELSELSNCSLTGGGFTVRDWFGNTVACVDAGGNLCLAGRLYQNP